MQSSPLRHPPSPAPLCGMGMPARGGISLNEASWIPLDIDPESPIIFLASDTTPTTFAFRARYVGKNLKFGAFGDPAVCTVSV